MLFRLINWHKISKKHSIAELSDPLNTCNNMGQYKKTSCWDFPGD